MKKLSADVRKIDEIADSGDYSKAVEMLDSLLKKMPDHKALLSRRLKYATALKAEERIQALEKQYGV